ncbi:heterokaryon incompatibility protein-domain-containing protein [Ilyonectria robusta]|uniref:heterokaryon incompatibility protein-domain-containing protein n=1 Tax=Ilyonectria robusta TaxID=1079257 RepID=UPI001E8CD4A9|nr:heterokaryon incompatibility protein-domain-containing protein [Ilyonectria robusta]KAH8667679.1 heterokaryon incompatibility protein-domain-containing protein [Ilyonectria robusta]
MPDPMRRTRSAKHQSPKRRAVQKKCQICQKLLDLLQSPAEIRGQLENHVTISDWKDLVESKCPFHPQFIASALRLDLTPSAVEEISISLLGYGGHDHVQIQGSIKVLGKSKLIESGELYILRKGPNSQQQGSARLVNPLWVDHGLLRKWKEKCLSSHGDVCGVAHKQTQYNDHIRPTWVIDIWRQCLVHPPQFQPYVALSYVWGGTPSFMARLSNIAQLQNSLALSNGKTEVPIPRTIRDAMSCVERLGERYLWVDSLCIVQDDPVHKETEIGRMASIYANALLTIIASDGTDANDGLPGLSGLTGPRSATQVVHTLRPGIQVVENISHAESTKWKTRGWTYQESVFSRRQLFFEGNWVRWICQGAIWREVGEKHGRQGDMQLALSRAIPDPSLVLNMIVQYNMRDLTYPEDALNGFAGILNTFTTSFDGGFISGLPAAMFYLALLWEPFDILTRREAKGPSADVCLPSWSWIGWKGALSGFAWSSAMDFVRSSSSMKGSPFFDRVTPLVKWHWRSVLKAPEVPIQDTWFRYKQNYGIGGPRKPCPTGWTRYSAEVEPTSPGKFIFSGPEPTNSPTCFYKHDSEPESEFWYPVPLPDPLQVSSRQIAAPFISCRTRRACVYGGEVITPLYRRGGIVISVRGNKSEWIGAIRLQERLPGPDEDNVKSLVGQKMELVEVALGRVPRDARTWLEHQVLDEWDHEERPGQNEIYEYYHVFWIEWEDGIAYRKAMGRVEKNLWEAQARENIDLILG